MPKNNNKHKILVIKLSALGDFIQALGAMKAIKEHHPDAHITLLTTAPFENFGKNCGYFDDIWIDKRPKLFDFFGWLDLRKKLLSGDFLRVYDLQNNDRTSLYFKLFPKAKRPQWVGAAKGASHRNNAPNRIAGHALDGHRQTLELAGITNIEIDKLNWIDEDLSTFDLKTPFIIFVAGCAPQHPQKRWSIDNYAKLAKWLNSNNYQIVLIGGKAEKEINSKIEQQSNNCLNLTEKTSLFQIAAIAHRAYCAIGNDTGPMHIIGATGCSTISLFSSYSNPKRHAPKGDNVKIIQKEQLNDLDVNEVIATFKSINNNSKKIYTT